MLLPRRAVRALELVLAQPPCVDAILLSDEQGVRELADGDQSGVALRGSILLL